MVDLEDVDDGLGPAGDAGGGMAAVPVMSAFREHRR